MEPRRLRLELYTRSNCHLGNDLRAVCLRLAEEVAADLVEVNVDSDPALQARFGAEIPVLFVDGRKAVRFRTSERELRRILLWRLVRQRFFGRQRRTP
jgi:hypothetical protein